MRAKSPRRSDIKSDTRHSTSTYSHSNRPVLRRPIESGLSALVAVDHCLAFWGPSLVDGHAQSVGHESCGGPRVDRPAHDSAAGRVEDHRAIHLALPGWVLGDVGDPQPAGFVSVKVAVHKVRRRGHIGDRAPARPTRGARQPGPTHQHCDRLTADCYSMTGRELRMDPSSAVSAPRVVVDPWRSPRSTTYGAATVPTAAGSASCSSPTLRPPAPRRRPQSGASPRPSP